MELTSEIRQRLKDSMESRNETGYTIHQKLEISATTIGNYLSGKVKKADNIKIKTICDLLKIDMRWLKTGEVGITSENNVVCHPEDKEEEYAKGSTEHLLNQILLIMTANNEQFSLSRKDMHNMTDIMIKGFKALNQRMDKLEAENKRLKKK